MTAEDPWAGLTRFTPARLGLGRAGVSLPTAEVLRFSAAHAAARDAVHAPFVADRVAGEVAALGPPVAIVESQAVERQLYLRRPDLGRRLAPASTPALEALRLAPDGLVVVIGDGLSATAIHAHAAGLVAALQPKLMEAGAPVAALVVARGARVALGDEIGVGLKAKLVVMLIGERPGLSAPDGIGAYLTLHPRVGRQDSERNCVSNIRPEGLALDLAAAKIAWLVRAALALGATGVGLKDESDGGLVEAAGDRKGIGSGQ